MGQGLGQVLVASAGEADKDRLLFERRRSRERVRRLEGRDDPFRLGEAAEGGESLLVARGDVHGSASVPQERVLGAEPGAIDGGEHILAVVRKP